MTPAAFSFPKKLSVFDIESYQDDFPEKLSSIPAGEPSGLEYYNRGFLELEPGRFFAEDLEGSLRFCVRQIDKILPSAAVNKVLGEKVALIRETENREPGRKEKKELKERIIDDLLPKALSKETLTWCYIDKNRKKLFIEAQGKKAEEVFNTILTAAKENIRLKAWLTEGRRQEWHQWFADIMADRSFFKAGSKAEFCRQGSQEQVKCNRMDLSVNDLEKIRRDYQAKKMEIEYPEMLSCTIDNGGRIGGIAWYDVITEQEAEEDLSDARQILILGSLMQLTEAIEEEMT